MATKASKRGATKPSNQVVLYSVLRYENPGQLTIADHLSLGNDGKLYLRRSGEPQRAKAKLQPITLKESVAWFRVGHECSVKLLHGDRFADGLKMLEQALP